MFRVDIDGETENITPLQIVVSPDYHFTVIAMIDSGADMNCIQEGLIPSKYFEKSTERLVSANGS